MRNIVLKFRSLVLGQNNVIYVMKPNKSNRIRRKCIISTIISNRITNEKPNSVIVYVFLFPNIFS